MDMYMGTLDECWFVFERVKMVFRFTYAFGNNPK